MRKRFEKIPLSKAAPNVHGATVVGQGEDYLLLERQPANETEVKPKPRKRRKKAEPESGVEAEV